MAAARSSPNNLQTIIEFVQLCKSKFAWGDLAGETVMDIGCGKELLCSLAVLERFPKLKSILAVDNNPAEFEGMKMRPKVIVRCLADIQNRSDIFLHEEKIHKIISCYALHKIDDKTSAFQNVYRLLKPGGDAAFLFTSDFGPYRVLKELSQLPKYKKYFKGSDVFDWYYRELKIHFYREILAKIGFTVIEILEKEKRFHRSHFEKFNETLCQIVSTAFSVPKELALDIKRKAIFLYQEKFLDDDDSSCYRATEMSIFLTKPEDKSACFCPIC